MALTLDKLEALRDALLEARLSGQRSVTYMSEGQQATVSYKSDDEMARALADCERRIAALTGPKRVRTVRFIATKGA